MVKYSSKNKSPHYFINDSLVSFSRFDERRLRITAHDCVDTIVYYIDYQKEIGSKINRLCVVIPEFLGYIREEDDRKYLFISHEEENNNDILKDCEKILHAIFDSICDMNNDDDKLGNYCLRSLDKLKINSIGNDEQFDKLPIDTLLKFSWVIISNRLKIKNESYYFWNDMVYLSEFEPDLAKVNKRELRFNGNIYYIGCEMNKPQYNINTVNRLYLIVKDLVGNAEKIKILKIDI